MVAIQGVTLDQIGDGPTSAAVVLSLAKPPRKSRIHDFAASGWEIELKAGCEHVVARTSSPLAASALVDAAIDQTHRALDLTSVEDGEHLVTTTPADDHVVLEVVGHKRTIRLHCVTDLPIGSDVSVTVMRADGSIEPPPVRPPLAWAPAFRFHRLSQSSRDLFDAYRNLFLGFEALLDQLYPKGRSEGERQWLLRSVAAAGTKVDLARLATPGAADPARDLVDRIYRVRLQLFHAKTGRALIPGERVSYLEVASIYPAMLELWTEIVREYLSLKRGGSVVTHQGFRSMIEGAYSSVMIGVTADDTLPDKAETDPSPRGLPVSIFAAPARLIEVQPGRMGLLGCTEVSALPADQVVGRVVTLTQEGVLVMINTVTGGLSLEGADVLETINIIRLVNRGQPRTEFD